MTPSTLRAAGEALYGSRWQCELARALDVADRTLRRWLQGSSGIPPGVWGDCCELLRARQAEIDRILSNNETGDDAQKTLDG